ncbi:MAG: DNA primase large subunit PriL [Candidatus Bathyarchaeota archaeon]|nr:DNA primase large subunit PriL [Candidatus Bathyarchaeota archaeon]
MQLETVKFTSSEVAKYPFLKETTAHVQKIGLDVEDFNSPELTKILNRAEERVKAAILDVSVGDRSSDDVKIPDDVEIPSFPVAIIIALATKNSFIKKRYALAEAKQAHSHFQLESKQRLLAIARNFGWNIELNGASQPPSEFILNFADYLRNITHLRDEKWKLINRFLVNGKVYLNHHDVARLLQEEVQRRLEKRLDAKELPPFPRKIMDIAEQLNSLAKEKLGEVEMESFPKVVSQSAFPPCIVALHEAATKGRHLSHVGRFTLTSFLLAVGMPPEKVTEVFKTFSDYNARLTRYQVEHIAGEKGSGTHYTPPSCSTLQTHGVCVNSDGLCRRIRHPLAYYKQKTISAQPTAGRV